MDPIIAFFAAAVGYLSGSISFARLIARLVAPQADISRIEQPMPDSDEVFVSDSVSATAVRMHLGPGYGCLTAILDMLKVTVPTLLFRLWFPESPYYLIVAAFGVVGHDWPLYHRFIGGRGESPILGGLIVIDWAGVLVTNLIGWPLGVLSGNLLVLRWAWLVLMIPWLWFRTQDLAYVAYMVTVNILYWLTMAPELKQYFQIRDKGEEPSQEELAHLLGMGSSLGRIIDRYSLSALLAGRKPDAR
jgi:glycerol-3-phosphate acyltransferase PlsY